MDVKDIRDAATLGYRLVHHLTQAKLPRYQWTFLEGRTRLRFLAFSHALTRTNALCFAGLVLFWLRGFEIAQKLQWQTDWGSECGGESLQKIAQLNERFFRPVGAALVRFPLGRKGYNGRVEVLRTALRTDDEEFYLPLLERIRDERELVQRAAQWVYYYSVERAHTGEGLGGVSPWRRLRELGVKVPVAFALLPPIVLDRISTDWVLGSGNNLLTHYTSKLRAWGFFLRSTQTSRSSPSRDKALSCPLQERCRCHALEEAVEGFGVVDWHWSR